MCACVRVCVREKFEKLGKFVYFMVCVIAFVVVVCDFCHFLGDLSASN